MIQNIIGIKLILVSPGTESNNGQLVYFFTFGLHTSISF